MATLQELIKQKEELDRLINMQQSADKADAIAEIKRLMAENGLTIDDVTSAAGGRGSAAKKGARTGVKVAPKYKDTQGNSWSGRGLQPRWLKAALANGARLDDFSV